jgi:carboxymethylenebutenolidase
MHRRAFERRRLDSRRRLNREPAMGEIVSYPRSVSSDDDGDVDREVDGECRGYLARPPTGVGPGVIVIHERWGLVGHITGIADRLAAVGFVALAPDLYHGRRAFEPDDADRLAAGLLMSEAGHDIVGAADYLLAKAGSPSVRSGEQDDEPLDSVPRVGAVGFGMGGGLALWSATWCEPIVAVVGFYPALPGAPAPMADSAVSMAPRWSECANKSALLHCADRDGGSASPVVQATIRAVTEAGGACTAYDYPGTADAFFNDDRPETYHASAAATAWARTLGFLRSTLG